MPPLRADPPGVVFGAPAGQFFGIRIGPRGVRIARHPVERQRLDGVRPRGVQIHVLPETVGKREERAAGPGGRRRDLPRVEPEPQLISVPGDDVAVVDRIEEGQHVPVPRVFPLVRPPDVPRRARPVAVLGGRDSARPVGFGIPGKAELGRLGVEPPLLNGHAGDLGKLDPVPVDAHVGPDSERPPALDRKVVQGHDHGLGQARREPHPVGDDLEPVAAGDLQNRRLGADPCLGSREVGTRVGVVHPSVEEEDLGDAGTHPVERERQVVRLRVSLEGEESEIVHVVPVHPGERRGHLLLPRGRRGRGVGRSPPVPDRDQPRVGVRRARHQAFPREDVHVFRMVHHPQRRPVVEDDLFELVHPAHLVRAVPGNERKRFHLHDFRRVREVVGTGGEQVSERAPAQEVGDEADPLSVPGVEDGTGGALPVQLLHRRRCQRRHVQFDLLHAARPEKTDVVGRERVSEPEVNREVALRQVPRRGPHLAALAHPGDPDLDLGADPVQIAAKAPGTHGHPVPGPRPIVPEGEDAAPRGTDHGVEIAIAVQIAGRERSRLLTGCEPGGDRSGA